MDLDDETLQRLIQSKQTDVEYNEQTDTFDILNSDGKTIEKIERTEFDDVVQPAPNDQQISEKSKIDSYFKYDDELDRKRTYHYLQELKNMSEHQLEAERENIVNVMFDLGDDLNGNNLSYRDLQLALITGKDLDGIDIPNDTPEERNAEEIEQKKYERKKEEIKHDDKR